MKNIFVAILIVAGLAAGGQEADSLKSAPGELPGTMAVSVPAPRPIPNWTLYIPGAVPFYEGKILKGVLFSTLEIGGVAMGITYDKYLKSNSSSPYYNYPLFIGLQAFSTEKLALFKNQLEIIQHYRPGFRYDDISDKELYLAPFRAKNVFTPITGGMVMMAALFLGIEKHNETRRFGEIEQMFLLNRYVSRNQGLAAFGTVSMAMSWSAGVGEEYLFRNWMMPLLDYRFGQKKGLILSSALFGTAHLSNLLFSENPDIKSTLLQVGEATLAGYFLGRDVQRRGYDIGPAVAAHMWYDFTLMLGSFLINPRNNFLGVNLKFRL